MVQRTQDRIASLGLAVADARGSVPEVVAAETRALRQAIALDERLAALAVSGGLDALAEGITALSGLACAIHRVGSRRRVAGGRRATSDPFPVLYEGASSDPDIAAALAGLVPGRATVVGPFPALAPAQRFVVVPIDLGGTLLGHVVIAEHGRRLDATDGLIGMRAARLAALELASRQRLASLVELADAALARDLLGVPPPPGALEERAAARGVDFDNWRHVVCHITTRDRDDPLPVDAARIVRALRDRGHADVLALDVEDGVAVILRAPRGGTEHGSARALQGTIVDVLGSVGPGRRLVAAISHVCRDAADLPGALAQCRRVALHRPTYGPGGDSCILADEVGLGRLFLSSVSPREMRRFAEDALGSILDPSGRWLHLVATLVAYFEEGRSMRGTAARLTMHENTVRYRLKKVEALTGLDVIGSDEDQLTAQIAVSFLNVGGARRATADQIGSPGQCTMHDAL